MAAKWLMILTTFHRRNAKTIIALLRKKRSSQKNAASTLRNPVLQDKRHGRKKPFAILKMQLFWIHFSRDFAMAILCLELGSQGEYAQASIVSLQLSQ
jgi:hypothetical protein